MLKIQQDPRKIRKVHVFDGEVIFIGRPISVECHGFRLVRAENFPRYVFFGETEACVFTTFIPAA